MVRNKIDLVEQVIKQHSKNERLYYDLLDSFGGPICNYSDYLSTEPINCDVELKDVDKADLKKCLALLTMVLREDHFCCGTLVRRIENGQVKSILERMVFILKNTEVDNSESID